MSTIKIKWEIQKDDAPAWGDSLTLTDATPSFNRVHPLWNRAMDLLRIVMSETLDEKVMGLPPLDMIAKEAYAAVKCASSS